MTSVSFYTSDYKRLVAEAELILKNRYFEQNPFLTEDGSALIARPGLKHFLDVGDGPVRGIYTEPGSFGGDLFVAAYDTLYRVDKYKNVTTIVSGLFDPYRGVVNMTSTAPIGDVPEFLFIADGRDLYVYTEDGYAFGTISGSPANNDVVRVDLMYYQFTNGSVDGGSPDGSSGNPWRVALGLNDEESWLNLVDAFQATGTPGTTYSTALEANPQITIRSYAATQVTVQAALPGTVGNSIITTETGSTIEWTSGTLTGGGDVEIHKVQTPDDVGIIDVATISSYVICVPVQGEDRNGRFYWIQPGETTINPLDFATAESHPDEIFGVEVLGDQFWLPGEGSTEVWYVAANSEFPMQRLQGVVFDRGTWEGTAVAIHESLIVCDANGAVFRIRGGQPQRISNPAIEETIRKSIEFQQSQVLI